MTILLIKSFFTHVYKPLYNINIYLYYKNITYAYRSTCIDCIIY